MLVARSHLSFAAVLLLLAACTDQSGNDDRLEPWTLVEELRIGSIDDPETALTAISDVAIGTDGAIYVLQSRDMEVRVFDPQGTPTAVIGGAGEGPGEFRMMVDIGLLEDTLYVLDGELRRISYFSPLGSLLGTQPLAALEATQPRFPAILFADGTGLAPLTRSREGWAALLHTTRDGIPQDTFLRWSVTSPSPATPETPLPAVSPNGRHAYVVERTTATDPEVASFRVHRLTLGGDTIWSREYGYVPVPVPRAEYDSIVASIIERNPTRADRINETRPYVPFRVPITASVATDEGFLWVRRENVPGAIEIRWDIVDAEGERIATTTLPDAARVLAVHADVVYATIAGDLGVPYLVRYRAERE